MKKRPQQWQGRRETIVEGGNVEDRPQWQGGNISSKWWRGGHDEERGGWERVVNTDALAKGAVGEVDEETEESRSSAHSAHHTHEYTIYFFVGIDDSTNPLSFAH